MPNGIATSIAMSVIIKVPANSGTEPNFAPESTPSASLPVLSKNASPGDQVVPVIKYQMLFASKNSIASSRIDNKIAKVVRIEIVAQSKKMYLIIDSKISLAFVEFVIVCDERKNNTIEILKAHNSEALKEKEISKIVNKICTKSAINRGNKLITAYKYPY